MPARCCRLLNRLDAERLADRGEVAGLLVDRRGKLGRRTRAYDLPRSGKALRDDGVAEHGPDVGGDAPTEGIGDAAAARCDQADQTVEVEAGEAGLRNGRQVQARGAAAALD